MGSGTIEIDLHGLRADEAKKKIDQTLRTADKAVYRIRLIHGFHRGHGLKNMILEEYSYQRAPRVLRVEGSGNEGTTELVLREY